MQIWVDADACPWEVKKILFRAADRESFALTLVANARIHVPPNPLITCVVVPSGIDVADRHIAESVQPGDLVITADIPLAADVVAAGAEALNPRGELYDESNVEEHLATRNMMDSLREGGQVGQGGPKPYGPKDKQAFADKFNRWLTAALKRRDK